MSKVQMVAGISGTRDGVDWPPIGGVLDCTPDEAKALISAGLARAVPAPSRAASPVVETATAAAVETATKPGLGKKNTGL